MRARARSTFVHAVFWTRIAPTRISKRVSADHQGPGSICSKSAVNSSRIAPRPASAGPVRGRPEPGSAIGDRFIASSLSVADAVSLCWGPLKGAAWPGTWGAP